MSSPSPSPDDFVEWAAWFTCLADPTRLRILHFVSSAGTPVTVGEIVDAVAMSQSTVSRHLQILGDQRFVFSRADGVRTLVTANELCMTELPLAAEAVMGQTSIRPKQARLRSEDGTSRPSA